MPENHNLSTVLVNSKEISFISNCLYCYLTYFFISLTNEGIPCLILHRPSSLEFVLVAYSYAYREAEIDSQ